MNFEYLFERYKIMFFIVSELEKIIRENRERIKTLEEKIKKLEEKT